jgi:transcriptional regulator with XRE-family HTH domain
MQSVQCKPLIVARKHLGISQIAVARGVAVDKAHISRIEAGKMKASPALANQIEVFFGGIVTRDQILYPEDYQDFVLPKKRTTRAELQEAR